MGNYERMKRGEFDELEQELKRAIKEHDPVPPEVVEQAKNSFNFGKIFGEIESLPVQEPEVADNNESKE